MQEIFTKFITHSNDFTGKIAYSEFEKDKLQWQKDNPDYTEAQLKAYISNVTQPAQIERLKNGAENNLNTLFRTMFGEELKNIYNKQKEELGEIVKNNQPSFWNNMASNFLGSLIFALVLYGVYLVVNHNGSEIDNAINPPATSPATVTAPQTQMQSETTKQ